MKAIGYIKLKRTFILCVFFVFACTPAQEHTKTQTQAQTNSQLEPLLSLSELLRASDVQSSLAIASKEGDLDTLKYWQELLLNAANEVNLRSSERALLEGEQGLVFLEFQGMKTNYKNAFEQAFYNFEDVDKVFQEYPAFVNLHEPSKKLVIQRDELVNKVAEELKNQGYQGDTLAEAKRQWQNYFIEQEKNRQQKMQLMPES